MEVSHSIIQLAYPSFHFKPMGQQIKRKTNGKEVYFELFNRHSVVYYHVPMQHAVVHRRVWPILKPIWALSYTVKSIKSKDIRCVLSLYSCTHFYNLVMYCSHSTAYHPVKVLKPKRVIVVKRNIKSNSIKSKYQIMADMTQ